MNEVMMQYDHSVYIGKGEQYDAYINRAVMFIKMQSMYVSLTDYAS